MVKTRVATCRVTVMAGLMVTEVTRITGMTRMMFITGFTERFWLTGMV